ncbi:MAG: helix-turn-helix transcriptional regulator [Candidatus Udaeobacter sp.]
MRSDTLAERATKRRFALLALLHECPRRYDEMIRALEQDDLFAYDCKARSSVEQQQQYQFRRDLRALRQLNFQILYDRASLCYRWCNPPFGLSLNESQLTALALLLDTFADTTILHAADIQALLAFLVSRLPTGQQKHLNEQRRFFDIDLCEMTNYLQADPLTISRIEFAIRQGQQLEFLYRSSRTGKELRHLIEPRPLLFKNGHVYLYGWSIEYEKELYYRLDYIIPGSAKPLPRSNAPGRPPQREYLLRYRLNAAIVRRSVSHRFPNRRSSDIQMILSRLLPVLLISLMLAVFC